MKAKSLLIGAAALALATVVHTQTSQSSQSSSGSQSTNGSTSVWSSGGGSASASSSAGGFAGGSAGGSSGGSASGSAGGYAGGSAGGSSSGSSFGLAGGKPTHAIMYKLELDSPSSPTAGQAFEQHTRHLSELRMKGKVLLFGPWRDLPGSMAIVIAKSDDDALAIAKSDPAVRSGALSFEVRAWNVMPLKSVQSESARAGARSKN